jgi:phage gp36-like protein
MAYASVQDMIDRFGAQEIARLSTPADRELDGVVSERVDRAIEGVSATLNSYIRQRYETPLDVAPLEIARACMDLARYDLATGDGKLAAEDVKDRAKQVMEWLRDIARGTVKLDLNEVAIGTESYAQVSIDGDGTRQSPFGQDNW